MQNALILDSYAFDDFEVPQFINFGGRQRYYIHRFLDGTRLVDLLGQDDADVAWSGVFNGNDAVERARGIDLLRSSGVQTVLTWDSFVYEVFVAEFDASYQSPWWIPYRIRCTIVSDEASAIVASILPVASAIASDMMALGTYVDASPVSQLPLEGAGVTPGTATYASNMNAIATFQGSLLAEMTSIGTSFPSLGLSDATARAGRIAALSLAQGYAGRIATNLATVTT